MSKEAKMVFENRLKIKLKDKFGDYQEELILTTVQDCLKGFNLELGCIEEYSSEEILKNYVNALEVQGRSPKTIKRYEYMIKKLISWVEIPIQDVTVFHLRAYLTSEKDRGLANSSLEGLREIICAFFNWLHREGLVLHNPVANLGPIKSMKKVRTTYSEIDIEKLKKECKSIRDKAIVCFLYSTGCRISEMTQLNISDINISTQECKVLGKGNKERTVYFDAPTGLAIEEYLNSRKDNNEALFVSNLSPYRRLEPDGVRYMMHQLQCKSGVEHVHPHKFRRTRATRLVRHGMPIQEVAAILGHEKLDTTMRYVVMDQHDIKTSYQKYV